MAENHVLLETIQVTQATSSVIFDNLPTSGYTDLKVVHSIRFSNATNVVDDIALALNGVTTSFSMRRLFASGSSVNTDSGGSPNNYVGIAPNTSATANTFGNGEFYISNYRSSANKTISCDSVSENNATAAYIMPTALLWSNSSPIISITLTGYASNFLAGSTISLYGVSSLGTTPASEPSAFGGNIVASDANYWYHAFTSSGTFTPFKTIASCDYLVVAGGGGSGRGNGTSGGGGAGGLLSTLTATGGGGTLQSPVSFVSGTTYTVTVGAGGAGPSYISEIGTGGSNSSIIGGAISIASSGGGRSGGGNPFQAGLSGGSGGGGGEQSGTYGVGGAGTNNQGYAGSQGGSSPYRSGGGGGAGAAASSGSANGGVGLQLTAFSTATGTGVSGGYFAGGGGGGGTSSSTGGTGGGGNGSSSSKTEMTAGTANTGGGAGGGYVQAGVSGGSGIVILRYAR